jgi:hypothetical protein
VIPDERPRAFTYSLEEGAKLVLAEPRVTDDAAHGEGVHGVMPRDRDDPNAAVITMCLP